MYVRNYLFGPLGSMELSSFKWWNSKRREYSTKLLYSLLSAQAIFLLWSLSLEGVEPLGALLSIPRALIIDVLLISIVNLIYFIWPTLEFLFFEKINILYRKYTFALLNLISASIFIGALFLLYTGKA